MSAVGVSLAALGALIWGISRTSTKAPASPSPPATPGGGVTPAVWPSPPLQGGTPAAAQTDLSDQVASTLDLLSNADPIQWSSLVLGSPGARIRIGVTSAPLSVKGAFVMVRPKQSQWLADALGGVPLTPYVGWQMVDKATVAIPPPPWHEALTVQELQAHVEAYAVAKLGRARLPGELIAGAWKWWILSRRLWEHSLADARSANFGLFPYGAAGGVIQTVGTVHNLAHTDWSQLHQHMAGMCEIETPSSWIQRPTADVLTDPTLAPRLCGVANQIYAQSPEGKGHVIGEGPLPGVRHPYIVHWSLAA